MKKRASKTKATSKSKRAAKPSAARPAAKTMQAPKASRGASYQPPPLKSDGWPPFRYPVK
jgi:hypothetical protein